MVIVYLKRLAGYGALTLILAGPPIYHMGYRKGVVESALNFKNKSGLEKITKNKFVTRHPRTCKKYVIDFENMVVQPYSKSNVKSEKDKDLEGLFE